MSDRRTILYYRHPERKNVWCLEYEEEGLPRTHFAFATINMYHKRIKFYGSFSFEEWKGVHATWSKIMRAIEESNEDG